MRRPGETWFGLSPALVGTLTVLVSTLALFMTYLANSGLPFVPAYEITVTVPDASALSAGREVRVAGKRVGLVKTVVARPRKRGRPVASLDLSLEPELKPIRSDTAVRVRPISPLGAKYLELAPGRRGRALAEGEGLPLSNTLPSVDMTEALDLFDVKTRRSLQGLYDELGDGTAGRGTTLNEVMAASPPLLGRLERVGAELSRPSTRLDRFVGGAERTASELGSAHAELGRLVDSSDVTFGALDAARAELADSVSELPATEDAGISALRAARPALADAEHFIRAARPGLRVLRPASVQLSAAISRGVPVLRRATRLAPLLSDSLRAVDRLSRDPTTQITLDKLRLAVRSLGATLRFAAPAQTVCNYGGLAGNNFASALSEGDASGTWLRTLLIIGRRSEELPSARPVEGLHVNPYAATGQNGECEAGNEPFLPGTRIGPVPGNQGKTEGTSPGGDGSGR